MERDGQSTMRYAGAVKAELQAGPGGVGAKEAAEAMQLKIQQEKKEEIDRLKTQYTFKAYNHLTST